ncbi:MAG TPA: oligosaccharide flippase family protein [Ferruginibacter sp.]|nr:oligosaccharide flippase family protein [Ferruginibacter sp.]HMP20186.1 oligosaccharide flippase family protein [Ferruginibacter sp.]
MKINLNRQTLEKHGATLLYIATLVSVGLSFFGSVLNSKMLSKELFGDLKYAQNYLMMVSYLINFGLYNSAGRLIAATDNKERISIFKGYMLMCSLAGLIIILITTLVLGTFWPQMISPSLFVLMLSMFPLFIVHPLMFYLESVFQSEKRMIAFSMYRILPPLLYILSLYLFRPLIEGSLFYAMLLYYVTYLAVFAYYVIADKKIFKRKSPELTELIEQNKSYGVHLYYGSLWNVGATYLLPILIGLFNINNEEVGPFTLASSFIMPFSLLPAVLGTAYFKEFMTIDTIPAAAFKKVLLASFGLIAVTWLTIDYVIDIFLGEKYASIGFLVKFGAFAALLQGLGDFVNKFLSAKGRSPYIKKVAVAVGTIQLIASLFLIKWLSSTGAMLAKTIGSAAYFGCLYYYYRKNFYNKTIKEKTA